MFRISLSQFFQCFAFYSFQLVHLMFFYYCNVHTRQLYYIQSLKRLYWKFIRNLNRNTQKTNENISFDPRNRCPMTCLFMLDCKQYSQNYSVRFRIGVEQNEIERKEMIDVEEILKMRYSPFAEQVKRNLHQHSKQLNMENLKI